jgi:hypothetical protein
MTLSKFLTYWSLTFAILVIWGFSVAVAFADVKDEALSAIRKKLGRARLRPIDPLAGRAVSETLATTVMDEKERWVFHVVSEISIPLKLNVRIMVVQDSMAHYLVHFAQGKRLLSYRVDKTWVADAMAGKAEARERIHTAVDQYLRQEFLGQKIPPKVPAPPAAKPAAPAAGGATPAGAPAAAATPTVQPEGQAEMSREEKIAAAKAKAEAMKAERAAGGGTPPAGGTPRS